MDIRRELQQRFGSGRCLIDSDVLLTYEIDALAMHRSPPLAVVLPESTAEVQDAVAMATAAGVAFLARGAGTGLSGGATPVEGQATVVIDTSRMRGILEVHEGDLCAVVQPGVVNLELTRAVTGLGLHYAPDPSSQSVCTIGGNVAENSGGPHCFKYGMTTDHLLGVKAVLADASVIELGGAAPRPVSGFDLVGLFCGSEGTLGIATEITVRLSRNPAAVETLLASFSSMRAACATVSAIVGNRIVPAALEILDSATIGAVEASVYRAGYPKDAAAVLLVELDGPVDGVRLDAEAVARHCRAHDAIQIERASDEQTRRRLWRGRKGAFGAMGRLRPNLYVLDGVVPRTKLVDTLEKVTEIGQRHRLTLTNVFHAGDGNLHPNISYDGRDPDESARVVAAGREILEVCIAAGGSITGEHGIGCEKLDYVALMFDDNDLATMNRVRAVFDPAGVCNPGKVLPLRSACAEASRWPQMVARILDS